MSKRSEKVRKRKQRKKYKAAKITWTKFQEVKPESMITKQTDMREYDAVVMAGIRMFANSRYQVLVRNVSTPIGVLIQLSIRANNNTAKHDWRDFQRIKNELLGPEIEGVELYPAESRLVDTSNQFYMYCIPPKVIDGKIINERWPFGFQERLVSDQSYRGMNKQRPWPKGERPKDAKTISEDMVRDYFNALKEEQAAKQSAAEAHGDPHQPVDHQEEPSHRNDEPGGHDQAEVGREGDHGVSGTADG